MSLISRNAASGSPVELPDTPERMENAGQAYRTLLESTNAIPWKIDWQTMQFAYIGPQIENILGWAPSSWVSAQDWSDRMHPEDREWVVNFCIEQSRAGVDHEADYRALTSTGEYVWIRDVVHVARNGSGEVDALIGFMFDISKRKKAEQELQATYEKISAMERQNAAANERQRIMEEIHDGVGSQLVSALVLARQPATTTTEMVSLIQDCLDDMRMAIDSMVPENANFIATLNNLRYRMDPRFRALGIDLQWRSLDAPDTVEVAPHTGLQVLRIFQEALTNIIKHAEATRVDVDLSFLPECIDVRIMDNGIGFSSGAETVGHGLRNMRMRAGKIGGMVRHEHLQHGTALHLRIPLNAAVPD